MQFISTPYASLNDKQQNEAIDSVQRHDIKSDYALNEAKFRTSSVNSNAEEAPPLCKQNYHLK